MRSLQDDRFAVGLLNCCAKPGGAKRCCFVTCCSCFAFAELLQKLPKSQKQNAPFKGNYQANCCLYCVGTSVSLLGTFMTSLLLHGPVRNLVSPIGRQSPMCDVLATTCCGPCALMQEMNELDLRAASKPMDPAVIQMMIRL
jgi:hypothetical protein